MEVLKGIVKVALAVFGLAAAGELGKRGIDNIKKGIPQNENQPK